jgi:hypothetical protein
MSSRAFDFFGMAFCGPTARLASHYMLIATSLEAYIISNYTQREASKRFSVLLFVFLVALG